MKQILQNVDVANLSLNEICRFCLTTDGILLSIFGYEEGSKLFELPLQLQSILSLEMEKDDGLPSLICHSCLYKLEESVDFKNQCKKADVILRNCLENKCNIKEAVPYTSVDGNFPEETNDDLQKEVETEEIEAKEVNSDCEAEVDVWEPDVSLETEENVTGETVENIGETADPDVEEEEEPSDNIPTQPDTEYSNQGEEDVTLGSGNSEALLIEEKMNEMEEERFASEPFSLDLCSVREQCELFPAGAAGSAHHLLPPPPATPSSTHLTDDDQLTDSNSEASEELEGVQTTAGSCNCPMCNKAFTSQADLQRHQLIHKQEPPYPCDYCDQDFEEKLLLKAHWRKHAMNRPHLCLTCGEAFMERWQLVKHFTVHDRIKPYHCAGCGKAFTYRSDLRKHAIIHTGVRPFKCPVCGKTFTRSTNLNKHARLHSGRRPYPCEHCDKMFSSRGDLVRHAVIHTGEKPYACLICSLAFNRKDKLIRHERVHATDRPFACTECPSSFHRKEELTKHIRFNHFKPDPDYFMPVE